jgi:hypothetical protein
MDDPITRRIRSTNKGLSKTAVGIIEHFVRIEPCMGSGILGQGRDRHRMVYELLTGAEGTQFIEATGSLREKKPKQSHFILRRQVQYFPKESARYPTRSFMVNSG